MKALRKVATLLPILLLLCLIPAAAPAQISFGISISVHSAPPILPVYVQPPCPTDGWLWVPGYWAWGTFGYYWVPGVWVAPPGPGLLWTPGYWGFGGGVYGWHPGYWGTHVGFYGGVNYGGGYGGVGFIGGGWSGGVFRYNTAVVNVNTTVVRNVYVDRTVINSTTVINSHAAFNGPGGVTRQATPQEQAAMHEPHVQPTAAQVQHETTARADPTARFSANHGHPATVAMVKPGVRAPVETHATPATKAAPAERTEAKPMTATKPTTAQRPMTAPKPMTAAKPEVTHPAPAAKPAARPAPAAKPAAHPAPAAKPKEKPQR